MNVGRMPSGLPVIVDDTEDLARFLNSSKQFNAEKVRASAFFPSSRDGQTSVFRHGIEPRTPLWQLASDYVVTDRTLYGAAIVKARHIRAAGLDVVAEEPPPRHANIIGWASSQSDPELARAELRQRAVDIAEAAVLVRP